MGVVKCVDMDHRIKEPPTVIEPISQYRTPDDLAGWLSAQFPDFASTANWPAEAPQLPTIDW
jgi:hypothetical protein